MQLSKNISLYECIKSETARRLNIDNTPTVNAIDNLSLLAINCLQPIRSYFDKPLIISSGYRCYELNKAVGGAKNSQHTTGMAVDFIVKDISIKDVINYVRNNLEFDQLIDEYSGNSHWIHISFNKYGNRKEVLRYRKGVYTRI